MSLTILRITDKSPFGILYFGDLSGVTLFLDMPPLQVVPADRGASTFGRRSSLEHGGSQEWELPPTPNPKLGLMSHGQFIDLLVMLYESVLEHSPDKNHLLSPERFLALLDLKSISDPLMDAWISSSSLIGASREDAAQLLELFMDSRYSSVLRYAVENVTEGKVEALPVPMPAHTRNL